MGGLDEELRGGVSRALVQPCARVVNRARARAQGDPDMFDEETASDAAWEKAKTELEWVCFISTVPPLPPSPRACALAVKFAGKVHDEPRPRAGELARRPLRLGKSRTAPGRQRAAILRFREGARRGARVRSRERAPRDRARLGAHFPRFRCKKTRINACRARPMDSRGERAPSRST